MNNKEECSKGVGSLSEGEDGEEDVMKTEDRELSEATSYHNQLLLPLFTPHLASKESIWANVKMQARYRRRREVRQETRQHHSQPCPLFPVDEREQTGETAFPAQATNVAVPLKCHHHPLREHLCHIHHLCLSHLLLQKLLLSPPLIQHHHRHL